MRPTSIRNRLLWSLLAAVGGVWIVALILSYMDAHRGLDRLFDAHLAQSAQLLSSQAAHELLEMDELEHKELQPYAQQFAVQLWDERGQLLMRMGPAPTMRFSPVEHGFSDATMDGVHWRVFSDWDLRHRVLVQMAEPHEARERLAAKMAFNSLAPTIIALPVLGGLIWWIVGAGLAPIRQVAAEVAQREPRSLARLSADAPREIQPLIERLNALFGRIERSIENEKRFTADAAHELRNPVAAIRAQAESSLGESDAQVVREGLSRIALSAERMSRLVGQLLSLARLDAKAEGVALETLDLTRVAQQTLAERAPAFIAAGGSVDLYGPEVAEVSGDAALLEVLIRNLLDNALRHGGQGVHATVRIGCDDREVALEVVDDGPGVPAALAARLGQRFVRAANAQTEGSGLGLSIVARICELHGATLSFSPGPNGRGLQVRVRFPRARTR